MRAQKRIYEQQIEYQTDVIRSPIHVNLITVHASVEVKMFAFDFCEGFKKSEHENEERIVIKSWYMCVDCSSD